MLPGFEYVVVDSAHQPNCSFKLSCRFVQDIGLALLGVLASFSASANYSMKVPA
jgi:hypothetical protein